MSIRATKLKKSTGERFGFLFSIFSVLLLAGCGAPGDPTPPSPPVPTAITDLAAHQAGDGVQLILTLPSNSISGEKLAAPPAVEILRGAVRPDGSPDPKSFRVVYTIPGALADNYRFEQHVRFTDPIAPGEMKALAGNTVAYIVRTRASQKRASANSNIVSVRLFPVPERITSLEARVTESAIELTWPAPARTSAGDPLTGLAGYRIYRAEIAPSAAPSPSPAQTPLAAASETPSEPLAFSEINSYSDISFAFDQTYAYVVRSVTRVNGNELESSDSQPVIVTPRDIFPPAAPQGLVAVLLPGATPSSLVVDLSWSINLETDLAGYHVYRSEQEGARGQLLTPDLLPTPAVRDTSVEPGHHYWYTVTAIDRAGNESVPSSPVAVEIAQPPS